MARKETTTEYLRYEFIPPELQEMGQELAKQYNLRNQIEEELTAVKAQFKERQTRSDQEIGRLSRLISASFEMRNVECRIYWHSPTPGFCTVVRTDTGDVIKERVMTMEERQELLPFKDRSDRTIPTPERVRGVLVEVGEDIALDEVAKFGDTDLCLVLEWAQALKAYVKASEQADPSKPTELPSVPSKPIALLPLPDAGQLHLDLISFRMPVPLETVEKWPKAERYGVLGWMAAIYHNEQAEGMGGVEAMTVPPRPDCLADYKRQDPEPPQDGKSAGAGA